ncbi:Chaperone, endoplasmic reticulum protein-folding, fungi [Phaffia rhodozyma]|uniref:Chaperone, endoplasmic reticulum protein-folding, fungi n=1 Tax=Phaffia rhodozyma TaxID=264483 RepID=A0A0F7SGH9_PHARH|nr:Chaperone, endoplasmic reticulum protein-folding, fungi [Phaffia rhodozyma]
MSLCSKINRHTILDSVQGRNFPDMLSTIAHSLVALASASLASAALDLSSSHNVTSLFGEWSTGSGGVGTGLGFANPLTYTFNYPATTGVALSFTNDGYYEEAQYRINANASLPNCAEAVVIFTHGVYDMNANGSLILSPFSGDGRIQVQNPCSAVTNVITTYNQTTMYAAWSIKVDTFKHNYALHLTRFDGASLPPMYLKARPPNMLPTVALSGYGEDSASV